MGDKVESETMSFGTYVKGIDGLMAGATSAWLYDVMISLQKSEQIVIN